LKVELDWLKKKLDISVEAKRQLVESEHPRISLRRQCALLGLARSGLYYRPVGESAEDVELMRLLDAQYTATPFYGIRRMTAWLRSQGYAVHHKHVSRLLRTMGLEAIYAKPRLSRPAEGHTIYPYLLHGVRVNRSNQVWSADITYIRLHAGFIYLVAVMAWFSRYVLTWAVSNTMDVAFCLNALDRALAQGQPEIFNTDQGAQFTAHVFTTRLAALVIVIQGLPRLGPRCLGQEHRVASWTVILAPPLAHHPRVDGVSAGSHGDAAAAPARGSHLGHRWSGR
jgi:putative transposase